MTQCIRLKGSVAGDGTRGSVATTMKTKIAGHTGMEFEASKVTSRSKGQGLRSEMTASETA